MSSESIHRQAIILGKKWLATCLDNHPSCAKKARHAHIFCSDNSHFITDLSGDGLVPSRLLKFSLEVTPDETEDLIKLVLSAELDEHTQYCALSHCWGSRKFQPLQTLGTNIESHVNDGIRYDDLPKTYRDAVEIARGMGYEYLWIDSLCIIQDSPIDWKREARRMAIIYDNAVFTIAAMDAVNSSQGLFPADEGRRSELESRAWTCQERMVAPRTLNFTRQSVTWECRQGHASAESENFVIDTGVGTTDYDSEEWIPPTQPKAIFTFFRDWRLPPKETKDEDTEPIMPTIMIANAEPGVTSPPLSEKDLPSEKIKGGKRESDDDSGVQEVSKQLSLFNTSGDEDLVQESDLDESAHANLTPHGNDTDCIRKDEVAEGATSAEDPPWVWSEGPDGTFKQWNVRPPLGESGVWIDPDTETIFTFIGSDLPAHAAHLRTQIDFPIQDQRWVMQFDEPWLNKVDPFGQFQVFVRDLMRPAKAYFPFIRVWWNLIALYTPRRLTYDSDAFLAINGITSVAQRWTHLRNTFGLWLRFFELELCWYIDPDVPACRPKSPEWLAPSWSWASTRQGRVKNAICREWSSLPHLLIKPEIGVPVGTAFDMPLPLEAWRKSRYHQTQLKGSLRKANIRRMPNPFGGHYFEVTVESQSRYSDHEVYTYYPDVAQEMPLGATIEVWLLPIWHFDGNDKQCKLGHSLDVMLVLNVLCYDYWIENYCPATMPEDVATDERTMRRLGLLEATYGSDQQRDPDEIAKDWMWKCVRIL